MEFDSLKYQSRHWFRVSQWLRYGLLAGILATGLYFRLANLGNVQQFEGDHGRDYMVVMDFVLDGHWPLVGPWRRVGDFTFGPGWYYTIMPALILGGFHPAAGAAFISSLSILMIFLCWLWVRRKTGSELTALVTAFCLSFSAGWITWDRMLCNPYILPLATVLIVFIIELIPRRPVAGLSLYIMLAGILPQWHSSGFLTIAASLPVVAWVGLHAWPLMRRTAHRTWLRWSAVTFAVLALLYAPPILNELKPGPGNLNGYLKRTIGIPDYTKRIENPAQEKPPFFKSAADRSIWFFIELANRNFGWQLFQRPLFIAVLTGWTLLWLLMAGLRLYHRCLDPSVVFLSFMFLGFWLVCVVQGEKMMGYFLSAVQPAPVLLSAWTTGRLLDRPLRRLWLRTTCISLGAGLLFSVVYLTTIQVGYAARIHTGEVFHHDSLRISRVITGKLYQEVGDAPYNLLFLQEGNFPAHMHYLMRHMGNRPRNRSFLSNIVYRKEFAQWMYIMTRGYDKDIPIEYRGLPDLNLKPQAIVDAFVYPLNADLIPTNIQIIDAFVENGKMVIEGKTL